MSNNHNALEHAFVAGTDTSEPKSFWEAMQRPDANLWYKAAVKEMQAHIENGTVERRGSGGCGKRISDDA
jgi:hypothetical protein